MVPTLFFYELALVALMWLFLRYRRTFAFSSGVRVASH
jgi:hypothetical protein